MNIQNNIGNKMQKLASIVLMITIIGGGLAILISLSQYEYIKPVMTYSIISILSSIILYFPMYGFGQIIINSEKQIKQNDKIIQQLEQTIKLLNQYENK